MLRWAILFLLISIVAGTMGFTSIAVGAAAAAKVLFYLSLTLFVVLLIAGLVIGETLTTK